MTLPNSEKEEISVYSDLLYICRMKSKVIIALLACYLIASTEFHQILRLPLLIEHYTEHSSKVDMTFWEFLVMHYETNVPHDDTDMSLPFKDCHHGLTFSFTAIPSQNISLSQTSSVKKDLHHSFDDTSFHSSYFCEIFQPPKI